MKFSPNFAFSSFSWRAADRRFVAAQAQDMDRWQSFDFSKSALKPADVANTRAHIH